MSSLYTRIRRPLMSLVLLPLGLGSAVAQDPIVVEEAPAVVEKNIYIPYEELWKVFEKDDRGVFLPYAEFQKLWEAAKAGEREPVDPEAPVAHLLTELNGVAVITQDVVQVTADLQLEVLKAGWHEIPLHLNDVAVTQARLGGAPAQLLFDADKGYRLLLRQEGDAIQRYKLSIEFARAYEKTPGRNRFAFQCPRAPVSRWEIRIPEPGVEVDVAPMLATTDAEGGDPKSETRVQAFVGATPRLEVSWTPKSEGARGLKALAGVQALQQSWIEQGVTRNQIQLDYRISRTEMESFQIEVPADQKVVNVYDENLKEWTVATEGERQIITATLFEPTQGAQRLVVELEQYSGVGKLAIPEVKALDVGRQRGVVLVRLNPGLRAEAADRKGLTQIDLQELPQALQAGGWQYMYRYGAVPYVLGFTVEEVLPRILAQTLTVARLSPDELVLQGFAQYDVQRAGVFRLDMEVPEGFELRSVSGRACAGGQPAQVESHQLADAVKGTRALQVQLATRALGKVGLTVTLARRLHEPALRSPSGERAELAVPALRAAGEHLERGDGALVLEAPESLKVHPEKEEGLRRTTYREALQNFGSVAGQAGMGHILAYVFSKELPALEIRAERRAPYISVGQLLVAHIESGVVKFTANLHYDIRYSGVKSLRVNVPEAIAGRLRVTTGGMRHSADAEAKDCPEGYVAWRLESQSEFQGKPVITLTWEEKLDKLDIGSTISLPIPRLQPDEINRAWGQIALLKAESIDVVPGDIVKGLRPIDPRHDLMAGKSYPGAARAFEFHEDWELSVKATRYEPTEIKTTSIERGFVRAVITRGNETAMQAVYRMRSANQRLAITLPEKKNFDSQALRINGRPVPLEKGQGNSYFIPLTGQQPDTPFMVELRYTVPDAGYEVEIPVFEEDPAVQQVYLSVYHPSDRVYLGHRGPWSSELTWTVNEFDLRPRGNLPERWQLDWVSEGVPGDHSALANFATDGTRLLYSTLRPEAEGASLKIVTMKRGLFQTLVLAGIVLIGLLLINTRLGTRLLVAGAGVVLLVLLAVFTPSFARSVISNAAVGAGVIVLTLWAVWWLVVMRPRRKAAAPPPPPMPEPVEEPDVGVDTDSDTDPDSDGGDVEKEAGDEG